MALCISHSCSDAFHTRASHDDIVSMFSCRKVPLGSYELIKGSCQLPERWRQCAFAWCSKHQCTKSILISVHESCT